MLDVVIRGGQVVTVEGVGQWDVAIQGERIVGLAAPGNLTGDISRVIDASGKLVIPGGIDPHVHASPTFFPVLGPGGRSPTLGPPSQVSQAALFGGTTTLIDFATWDQGLTISGAIARKKESWKDSYTDYSFHILLRGDVPPDVIAQIPEAISDGFPSFKLFTTDTSPSRKGHMMVGMGHVWAIMRQVAKHHGVVAVHAEDNEIVMYMYEELQREGRTGYEHLPLIHNTLSEDLSFRRIIRLARHVEGAAVYMMHISAKEGVDAVAEARADGFPVYGETLHHFATFTAEAYLQPDGVIYHTYPSLKSERDRQRLWAGMRDGSVSTVATDEACTSRATKVQGRTIFDAIGGHVGVETRLPIIYTEAVSKRGLPLERFVALVSTNAAKIFGLYPRKGVIAIGSDADLVIFDPGIHKTLRSEDLHDSDYSAWEGWEVHGWPALTMLRGKVVVEDGQLKAGGANGQAIRRKLAGSIQNGPAV